MSQKSSSDDLPPPGHPSLRFDKGIFAENPARLKLKVGSWLAANPSALIISLCLVAVGAGTALIKLPLGAILFFSGVVYLFNELREARQKFYKGNVCPGVILSARDGLVAIYADLRCAGDQPYPAIQILKQPLHRMTTEPARDGMRVAAAALYVGDEQAAAWQNFWPEVVNCVVRDPDDIARVFNSIPEEEWQDLDACLARVPHRTLGLHRIDLPATGNGNGGWAQTGLQTVPPRPWFRSPAAIFAFIALGLIVLVTVLSAAFQARPQTRPRQPVPPSPTVGAPGHQPLAPLPRPAPAFPPRQNFSNSVGFSPLAPDRTGPYGTGAKIEADWAGGWISGEITRVNPGGFTVMVQLNDPRFPFPIVLGTNQIRLK